MEKVVKRGYVKWTDEDGVFHKEPLADHPDMLAQASPEEQIRAEEARRLNAAAEDAQKEVAHEHEDDAKDTLTALKAAPEEVLTASQLTEETPVSAPEADDHHEALAALKEATS